MMHDDRSKAHPAQLQASIDAKLDAACASAMQLQLAGQASAALQLYHAILQARPQHDAANYCLGMLHVQAKRPAESLPFLMTAVRAKPGVADYWLGALEAQLLNDDVEGARATLALGRAHGLTGAAVEEISARLEARRAKAALPPAALPPAALPRAALPRAATPAPVATTPAAAAPPCKTPRAKKSQRNRRRRPARSAREEEAELLALIERRDFEAAVPRARSLTERFPNRGVGWKILGAFVATNDGYDQAIAALENAVRLLPGDAEARVNLGLTLAKAKRAKEGEAHLLEALKMNPNLAAAHYRLAVAYEFQGRYADAEAALRRGIALNTNHVAGDDELSYSHLLFLMSHNAEIDAAELFAEHCRYGERFEGPLRSLWPKHANDRTWDRTLKVGFVSGDLCNHAVATFLEPILTELAKKPGLELHAYYTNPAPDNSSQRMLGNFRSWNVVWSLSDAELAEVIHSDHIDILFDLSGHTGYNRLPAFARKPAPVQISFIGYPGTTGLTAMDYFLADPYLLPPGRFDAYFTEKIVYLPAHAPFQPEVTAPPVNALPALATGRLTFGSFNRLGKLNDVTVRLWSDLLRALPDSRMLIAGMDAGKAHLGLVERFEACGIAADRLEFHERCGITSYLTLHHKVDICLDTTPYNGGTTTLHALWMGVPTLSMAGATPASRAGAAILGQTGLHDFVAADRTEFIAKGVHWAGHIAELARLRSELRERWQRSPRQRTLFIADTLERALRRMWRRWCDGLPPESFQIVDDSVGQGG